MQTGDPIVPASLKLIPKRALCIVSLKNEEPND